MFVAGLAMATLLLSAAGRYPRLLPPGLVAAVSTVVGFLVYYLSL